MKRALEFIIATLVLAAVTLCIYLVFLGDQVQEVKATPGGKTTIKASPMPSTYNPQQGAVVPGEQNLQGVR